MENIKKHLTIKVPAKATVWYIGSGGIARAIGALSTPIFTRILTPSEYGLYPLYNSWLSVLTVLVTLELTGSIIYRGYQKYSDIKDVFTSCVLGLIITVFTIFCALYFAFYGVLKQIIGLGITISFIMLVEIFAGSVLSLYISKAKFEYRYKSVAALNIVSAAAVPFLAIIIIMLTGVRAEARIYASAVISLSIAVPILFKVIKDSSRLYDKRIWKYLLGKSIPLIPHYFSVSLILRVAEISIGRTHGTDALAKYSVATSVGMILTVVTGGLLSALSPWMIRKIRDKMIGIIQEFLMLVTKGLSLIALIILAFAPELISLLAAEEFRGALAAVYPLEIAVILSFLSGAIMSGCAYFEKSSLSSLPSVISAFISVIFSLLLLPRVDYRLAGVFTLISYLTLALLTSFLFKRLSGEYPVKLKECFGIILLAMGYATVLFVFRGVFLSRLFLALPLLPLLYLCAKDIWVKIRE